jgi:predicted metalloprotease
MPWCGRLISDACDIARADDSLGSEDLSMKWTPGGSRTNLEDRRGQGGFGIGRMGLGGGGIILLILSLLFGRNLLDHGSAPDAGTTAGGEVAPVNETPEEATLVEFVNFVLNDANDTWQRVLPRYGEQYRPAKLVLFRGGVQSTCGAAQSAMGPFYCPLDERAYIDLGFYSDLRRRFGAPGDFAQAYVLSHEIGHHVQNVLGTSTRVREMQERQPRDANAYSVRLELQADCYAGVWANSTQQRQLLEQGDVEEGLTAAAAVGDDRLQRGSTGSVNPESFTHGTSEQRMTWFRRGFTTGDPRNCDSFAGAI